MGIYIFQKSKNDVPWWKNFNMITGLLVQDALVDYIEDHEAICEDDWKVIRKSIQVIANNLAKEYFKANEQEL